MQFKISARYRDWKNAKKMSSLAGVRDMMPTDIARDLRNMTGKVLHEKKEQISHANSSSKATIL